MSENSKREQFQPSEAKPTSSKLTPNNVLIGAAVLLVAVIAFVFVVPSQGGFHSGMKEIELPISDLANGQAKFYEYESSTKKKMRFFVVRSSDGEYRAAADACDVCYEAKQGYHQEGDELVCNKCGQRFPSTGVNEIRGGCNPAGVHNQIRGNKLVIQTAELEAQSHLF